MDDDDPHTDQYYFVWGMVVAFAAPLLCIVTIVTLTGLGYINQ